LYSRVDEHYRKPKVQSSIDNPETLAVMAHKTQDEDKQNKKTQHS